MLACFPSLLIGLFDHGVSKGSERPAFSLHSFEEVHFSLMAFAFQTDFPSLLTALYQGDQFVRKRGDNSAQIQKMEAQLTHPLNA